MEVVPVLRDAARSALQVERSKVAPWVGLRAATGVAVTLVVGQATGHTVAGVTATIGALSAGMASHQGTYRSRVWVVMAAAAGMGLAAFLGGWAGHVVGIDMLLTAVFAFAAGMLVSLGPAGSVVGIQAVVGLIVFSQFRLPAPVAARNGGLVLLGGAVQALLVMATWPLRRFPAERRTVGDAYAVLASYARRAATAEGGPDGDPPLLAPGALDGLEAVRRDPQPFGGPVVAAHHVLAVQADRIRLELLALARSRQRLAVAGQPGSAAALADALEAASRMTEVLASAVRDGTPPPVDLEERARFVGALKALDGSGVEGRVEALGGQLRAALRAAAAAAGARPGRIDEDLVPAGYVREVAKRRRRASSWAREQAATLRANGDGQSPAFRHGARLAVTLAAGVAISHVFPWGHRYWLAMTALLVLRPDFSSTLVRGLSRVVGTLVGAGAVTVVLAEWGPGPDWLIALVVGLAFAATALVLANYAVFSVCIASLVVTLLAFTGNPELATAGDRSIYTLAGAGLALFAYAVWPTWEARTLADTLAGLARTEAAYARAVLGAWADPVAADRGALQRSRLAARLARTDAEAAVTRWLAEPQRAGPMPTEAVSDYMAAMRNCVAALLGLHAELPAAGPPFPAAAAFGEHVASALEQVAEAVKGTSAPLAEFHLRHEQAAVEWGRWVLAAETDRLVNAVDTMGHVVRVTEGT